MNFSRLLKKTNASYGSLYVSVVREVSGMHAAQAHFASAEKKLINDAVVLTVYSV